MIRKNHWLILCVFLFPQLLWGLEAHDQSNTESVTDSIERVTKREEESLSDRHQRAIEGMMEQ